MIILEKILLQIFIEHDLPRKIGKVLSSCGDSDPTTSNFNKTNPKAYLKVNSQYRIRASYLLHDPRAKGGVG